ncbi:MAG: NDP-sugar synthase [Thermoplasmata archaeon]|nr:MAG: NDP-sugar synthase [Thermoplasmata archaeon]
MRAIILAGGFGTRLRPLTNTKPKALIPLMNKPMITYILDALPAEVEHVIIAAGYKIEQLRDFFSQSKYPFEITVHEEAEPLGTGGGMKNCSEFIPAGEEFLAFNGDVISSINFSDFIEFFHTKGGLGSIALWPVTDPSRYGLVHIDDNDNITAFIEKSEAEPHELKKSGEPGAQYLINAGAYIFKSEILELIQPGKMVSIEREIFPNVLDSGLSGYRFDGYWIDAGNAEDLINAHKILFDNPLSDIKDQYPGLVKRLQTQFTGAKFSPPIFTGTRIEFGEGCKIGPYVCFGDNVKVGANCTISNAVILPDSVIGDKTVIEDSIIGEANNIGNNCRIFNYYITADNTTVDDEAILDGETNN